MSASPTAAALTPEMPGQVSLEGTRSTWSSFCVRRSNRLALAVIAALGMLALVADMLASDKPLLVRYHGQLFVLPNLTNPAALRELDNQSLREDLDSAGGDWMIAPPVPYGPYRIDLSLEQLPSPPGNGHLLGTDETGRDVLARLIHGARVSLSVGLVAVALYVLIGIALGALAGYFGGPIDWLVSRAIEVMLSFPTLFLLLAILAMVERPSVGHLMVVLGLTRWPAVARLVRGEMLRLKPMGFVQASRALGASDWHILWRHLLPNAMGPVLVMATFGVAGAVLLESALSFLGFGAPPPVASWGEILTEAHRQLAGAGAWWLAVFPGLAIFATAMAYNVVGEGLREAMDPREG